MPEHETPRWKLPYPDKNGKANLGYKDLEELAKKLEETLYGEWLEPESHTSRVESSTVKGRVEMNDTIVRFSGTFTAKEAIAGGGTELLKLPAALRPSVDRYLTALIASNATPSRLTVKSDGTVRWDGVEVPKGLLVSLENITYAI